MNGRDRPRGGSPPNYPRQLYDALLGEARDAAAKAVARLRELNYLFPAAVPGSLLEQLARTQADPRADRRATIRLAGDADRVMVRPVAPRGRLVEARLLDRSPTGLSVRLDRPLRPGAVVRVLLPPAEGEWTWVPAQVRHCRVTADGWVVGCEFFDRPAG